MFTVLPVKFVSNECNGKQILFLFYFFIFLFFIFLLLYFFYDSHREREREAETQAEGEAGSLQEAQCGTLRTWDHALSLRQMLNPEPPRRPSNY